MHSKHSKKILIRIYLLISIYLGVTLIISACVAPSVNIKKDTANINASKASSIQHQFLNAVNNVRSKSRKCGQEKFPAAPALRLNNELNRAAYKHSLDMYENQFLDHISSNGDTLVERMQQVDYLWRAVGENIAHNQKSINQVIDDWLSSPGHCSNLMSDQFTETGVAQVKYYWTQVYATPE